MQPPKAKIKALNDALFTTSVESCHDTVFDKYHIESIITIGDTKLSVSVELKDWSDAEIDNAFGKIARGYSNRLLGAADTKAERAEHD